MKRRGSHKSPVATRCNGKVMMFGSIAEAALAMNIQANAISECCRGLVERAGQLEWWYVGHKRRRAVKRKHGRAGKSVPVIGTRVDDGFVKRFESMAQASQKLGISISRLSACLSGVARQTKGWRWELETNKQTEKESKMVDQNECRMVNQADTPEFRALARSIDVRSRRWLNRKPAYPAEPFSLDGEVFAALRRDFGAALLKALRTMQRTNTSEATLNLKMDISGSVDENCVVPEFEYKFSVVVQSKGTTEGEIKPGIVMIWSPTKGEFVCEKKKNPQTDMFEAEDAE